MKKTLYLLAFAAALVSCAGAKTDSFPQVTAHRGCHLDGLVPENSITGIETQINQIKTQLNRYDNDVAYSYVNIQIKEVEKIVAEEEKGTVGNAFGDSWDAFAEVCHGLLILLIWFLPYLIVILVILVIIFAATIPARRKRKEKRAAFEKQQEAQKAMLQAGQPGAPAPIDVPQQKEPNDGQV